MNPTIKVLDATGKVLAEATAKSTATRVSVRLPAWQRQLDSMWQPGAVAGEIGDTKFRFDARNRSQWVD